MPENLAITETKFRVKHTEMTECAAWRMDRQTSFRLYTVDYMINDSSSCDNLTTKLANQIVECKIWWDKTLVENLLFAESWMVNLE